MKDINSMGMGKCPRGSFPYRIKSGDTLYKLAQTYNTTVEAIMKLNPGINPKNLQIGQMICIPEEKSMKCPKGSFSYTIKSGDTLYLLAQTYNTTVEAIMQLNPGVDPYNLQIGSMICIPEKRPGEKCPKGTFQYTIKSGDTLYFLSIRYNTTVEEIMAINPGIVPENLQIGQKICIPEDRSYPKYPDHKDDYYYRDHEEYRDHDKYYKKPDYYEDDKYHRKPDYFEDDKYYRDPKDHRDMCKGEVYIVKAGDTLYGIADRYNVRVRDILKENPSLDPNNLKIGQLICIPR